MAGRPRERWEAALAIGRVTLVLTIIAVLPGQVGAVMNVDADSSGSAPDSLGTALLPAAYLPTAAMASPGPYVYPSCRFGVTTEGDIARYDVAGLNVGWYLDWHTTATPRHPGGAEYFQMINLSQYGSGFTYQPNGSALNAIIDANPGAVWLIGNEQDRRIYQDDLEPEVYAQAYHHLYSLIKERDSSAKIAIGGVVQPTSLRLQYLDAVWDAYLDEYGTPPPVDIWNVHSFILREISPDHPQAQQPGYEVWGAGIPRGSQFDGVMEGTLYQMSEQDDLGIFRQRIIEFREWMADKGQRDKPLIVTEYGVLFPEDYSDENGQQFSAERVSVFMQGTFDFFRNYTDSSIGYPIDGNRLVQRWAWFSVDANPWDWGGTLFDIDTPGTLRSLGEDFRSYATAIPPTVDVLAVRAFAEPAAVPYEGVPVTGTLRALVSNAGNVATTKPVTVTFYKGLAGQDGVDSIGEPQVVSQSLQGCGGYTVVSATWGGLGAGSQPFSVRVEIGDADLNSANDVAEGNLLVASQWVFLPMVLADQ